MVVTRRYAWLVVMAAMVASGATLRAEEGTAEGDLRESIRVARTAFRPIDERSLAERRQAVQAAMTELDRSLASARPGYAEGWKRYLRWSLLTDNLRDNNPDLAELQQVSQQFHKNRQGLELPKFTAVRERLQEYVGAVQAAQQRELQDQYAKAIDELSRLVDEYEAKPSGLNGPEIGRIAGWLQTAGQAPQLVQDVDRRFSYPNVIGRSSERLLSKGVNSWVSRTTAVHDNILGTDIHGTATFRGSQMMDVVPSYYDGRMNILIRGNVYSNNLGYNGPVTIRSTAVSSINGVKPIVVNENGIFALPAYSNARTSTTIHDICAKCGLIERIAWKRAGQQKAQAEAIASGKTVARINANANNEAVNLVAQANREFQEKFRWPLLRRGQAPQSLRISSDNYGVNAHMLQRSRGQIGAPGNPPDLQAYGDLAVQAHETAVANFSAALIGGTELTDERLAEMVLDATGSIPEELQIKEENEPWSITFEENNPVTTVFDGGQVTAYVRARRFTRGRNEDGSVDTEVNEKVEISAKYDIERTPEGATLKRLGEVNVDFVELEKLSAQQIGVKTFLRRKFSELFKDEFVGKGLELKGRLAGTKLRLNDIKSENGWVSAAWQE